MEEEEEKPGWGVRTVSQEHSYSYVRDDLIT